MHNTSHRRGLRAAAGILLVVGLPACALIAREGTIAYLAVTTGPKDVEVRILRSFLDRYKNRVGIDASLTIDRVMPTPYPPSLDGDLHFSGRAPEIGLPVVAEIANARLHKDAVEIAHRAGGSGSPIAVSGVWRIWPEHSGAGTEVQGSPHDAYPIANPAHVFEIHPVTRIGGIDLLDSFTPVSGFKPGDAERTFGIYNKATCTIRVQHDTVSLLLPQGLYNDVEFIMELTNDRQLDVGDGRIVNAAVHELKGDLVAPSVRMVFAAGTPPEIAVRRLKRGDRLHLYGMPRLDLAEVSRRIAESGRNPAVLTGTIPYEITVIGVFPSD